MPVIEIAQLRVDPARRADFLRDFGDATRHLLAAPGSQDVRLLPSAENDEEFVLLVTWDQLSSHVPQFVGSDGFAAFEKKIFGYFTEPPVVKHFVLES